MLLAVGVPAVGEDDDGVLGVEVGRGQGLLSQLDQLKVFWILSEKMNIYPMYSFISTLKDLV